MSIQFTKEQHSHTLNNSAEAPPGPPRHSSEVRDGAIRFWRYLGNLGNNNNNDKEMTAKKQRNACYDEKDCGFRSHHVPDARDREKGRMKLQSGDDGVALVPAVRGLRRLRVVRRRGAVEPPRDRRGEPGEVINFATKENHFFL